MITIIGAGPAGSYLAYLLAKKGKKVTLIEEHKKIGIPVQCTGIVTESIKKFIGIPNKIIANKLNKVIVVNNYNKVEANINEIVLWRDKFDQYLADLAEKEGVRILTNHKFIGLNGNHAVKIKDKNNNQIKEIITDYVIGADGLSSDVAKEAGLNTNEDFYTGMQAKVKLKAKNEFETYFGNNFPNFFGWVVPESEDTARIGLATTQNTKEYFYKFLEQRTKSKDIICWESGIIPIYNPNKIIQKGNICLIGDAATQVKATTGGGIIPSLKAANTLSNCIINKKDYNKSFKLESGKELLLHLKIRNILNKFSDKDYNYLLNLMRQNRIKKTLKKYDRDSPIQLMLSLLLKEPRLLSFGKFLF